MHSLRVNVSDNLFPQLMSYLQQFSGNGIEFVEDVKPDFVINNLQEAKDRILKAETSNNFMEHNDFWNEINEYSKSL